MATDPALADGTPGDFDFYVLSLSWSESYCDSADRPDPSQCDLDRPAFVVHGLWPQYERGYPEYCASSMSERLQRSTLSAIADIMPSAGLAEYQWKKHGICSGLRADGYFALLRQAFDRVVMPPEFTDPHADVETSPREIEAAFVVANPGLSERGIAVTCGRSGLIEVRICVGKDLRFRRCLEVDEDHCRKSALVLPGPD